MSFLKLDASSFAVTCTFVLTEFLIHAGFSYTMHCSPAFPVRMRTCYSAFQDTKVALYHSMLAIIRGTAIELHAWCRCAIQSVHFIIHNTPIYFP